MDADPFGLLGNVIDGKFRVDALVGDGELTVVYKGYDLGVQAPVAIKCLHLPDTLDQELTRPVLEAFEDAGRLQARFGRSNTHVAQIIAAGQTVAPRTGVTVPYRVREWFEGESLASELARRRRQGDKPRTVQEAFALLAPAIEGIAQAHEEGIAHLSLAPANLFLVQGEGHGSLRVLDFGTARSTRRADARQTLDSEITRGLHLLHPAYAAPEQLEMDVGDRGPWTDVYALALITMEVLAERSNVEGRDTPALVNRALDKEKRPTPQAHGLKLPRALDLLLTRAVERSPDARQKNARVFLRELKAAVAGCAPAKVVSMRPRVAAASAPSKPAQPPQPKLVRVRPPVRALGGAAAVLVAPEPSASPTQLLEAPLVPSGSQPEAPPSPTASASGPVPVALAPQEPPPAGMDPGPSFFAPPGALDPGLLALEQKLVRRRLSSRAPRLLVGAAALACAGVIVCLFVRGRARHPSPALVVAAAPTAPSASTAAVTTAPPPQTVAPLALAIAAQPAAAAVTSDEQAPSAHSPTRSSIVRFSWADAQHAVHSVTRRVAQCRHGRFWGSGYATVMFRGDGRVHQVLVDPPYSMTVTGKCVADALRSAHMRSFSGRSGYYRFRFYIAPR